jgi:hypothetical protein
MTRQESLGKEREITPSQDEHTNENSRAICRLNTEKDRKGRVNWYTHLLPMESDT